VARVEEKINTHRVLVRKPEGRRQLGRARPREMGNIKIDLKVTGWEDWGLD
jgi:hypothetical protein